MANYVIFVKPSMKKRLDFDHELMDRVGIYKLEKEQTGPIIARYLESRNPDDAYILTMSYLWVVKDLVCRYRAHFADILWMTDDLVAQGVALLTEFVSKYKDSPIERIFFSKCQAFINNGLVEFINDNRSAFAAPRRTNSRRAEKDKPLEYHYATELNEEIMGEIDEPYLIDILDSIEALNQVDAEEMRDLVFKFLKQNHDISEEELTDEERSSLEKLTELVRNAGL